MYIGTQSPIPMKKKPAGAQRVPGVAVLLFGLGIMLPAHAWAFELTGAWASQSDLCKLVFAKKGDQIGFTELSDLYGAGFIIDGNRIQGKSARCTIKSRKQEGDRLELSAACATGIMTSDVGFSLKVIDDNNLARSFPEIEGMMIKYSRCSL
jgi:hypothetical protein